MHELRRTCYLSKVGRDLGYVLVLDLIHGNMFNVDDLLDDEGSEISPLNGVVAGGLLEERDHACE